MAKEVLLSDLQFRFTPTKVECAKSPLSVGASIDSPTSARRKRAGKAKISVVALALDRILKHQYEAYTNGAGSVRLTKTDTGEILYFDGTVNIYVGSSGDINRVNYIDMCAIILTSAIGKGADAAETNTALEYCLDYYTENGSCQNRDIAFLCDCFYFDTMAIFGTAPGTTSSNIILHKFEDEIVRQFEQSYSVGQLNASMFTSSECTYLANGMREAATSKVAGVGKKVFMDACKEGALEIGYTWDEEAQARIQPPSFLDTFVSSRAFEMATQLCYNKLNHVSERLADGKFGLEAIGKDYANLIFVGKPGTGKTTIANALSATLGLPIYTCRLSKNTEEDEVEGKTKIAEGSFVFKETPFLKGFTTGGILVLEEFNLADPAVMQGALGQAIESPFILMKDGVEPVKRHPLTVIISTMNTGTQGSKEPNEAFASRHPFVFSVEDPKENDFVNVLMANTGASKESCKKVYSAYTAIQKYLIKSAGSEDIAMSVTLRHCIGALELLEIESFNDAIYDTMIGAIKIKDLEIAETVYKSCIQSKKY